MSAAIESPVVPNQPKTPVKCFRIPEDLYSRAMETASRDTEGTLTDAVRGFLAWYSREPGAKLPKRPD